MADKNGKPAWLTEQADGAIQVDFGDSAPVIDGTRVKSLCLREPTVEDQLTASRNKDQGEAEVELIANLAEQSPEAIRALTLRQYSRLQAALAVFLE